MGSQCNVGWTVLALCVTYIVYASPLSNSIHVAEMFSIVKANHQCTYSHGKVSVGSFLGWCNDFSFHLKPLEGCLELQESRQCPQKKWLLCLQGPMGMARRGSSGRHRPRRDCSWTRRCTVFSSALWTQLKLQFTLDLFFNNCRLFQFSLLLLDLVDPSNIGVPKKYNMLVSGEPCSSNNGSF